MATVSCEHRKFTPIIAALVLSMVCATSFADSPRATIPVSRGVLSALGKEKMTHTISPVYHEGTIYGFYQAGETHTVENVADPTELIGIRTTA